MLLLEIKYKINQKLNIFQLVASTSTYTLKSPKFGSNMDKPKCWVKNVITKLTVESES